MSTQRYKGPSECSRLANGRIKPPSRRSRWVSFSLTRGDPLRELLERRLPRRRSPPRRWTAPLDGPYLCDMNRLSVVVAVLALLVASIPVSAQNVRSAGDIVSVRYEERLSPQAIETATAPLFEGFEPIEALLAVDVYEVRFLTTDVDGSVVDTVAGLFVPVTEQRVAAPLLAFGSGTTGLGNQCAASLEEPERIRWGWYRAHMLSYASHGLVAVMPDYIGFHHPRVPQRYFSSVAGGRVLLDALRGARAVFEHHRDTIRSAVVPGSGNVVAGYSQGGHAAFSALDLHAVYAPEIRLDGGIGYGPTANVEVLMREVAAFTPYIFYSYLDIYGPDHVDPTELLAPSWMPTFERDVLGMCVDRVQRHYPFDGGRVYTPAFHRALQRNRLAEEFPDFKEILDENAAGLTGHRKPVLIIQGTEDTIVTPASQRRFTDQLRAAGSDVELIEIDDIRHRQTRQVGFTHTLRFVFEVTDSARPEGR